MSDLTREQLDALHGRMTAGLKPDPYATPGRYIMDAKSVVVMRCQEPDDHAAIIAFQQHWPAQSARIAALEAEVGRLREALTAHNQRAANGDEIGLVDEMEQAAGTLEAFIAANEDAAPNGLLDCADNDGGAYQSEWMEGLMLHAKLGASALRKWAGTISDALKGAGNE